MYNKHYQLNERMKTSTHEVKRHSSSGKIVAVFISNATAKDKHREFTKKMREENDKEKRFRATAMHSVQRAKKKKNDICRLFTCSITYFRLQ